MPTPKPRFEKDADGITRMIVPSRLNEMNEDGWFVKEQYNPEIHCCRDWSKDYCECVKEKTKRAKRKARNKAVRTTLNLLERNNIPYERTKTENVVQLYPKRNSGILLSLKCTNTEYGYKFTCRWIDGHWHYYTKQQLLDKLKPAP
jgi:hypothetical protein